MKTYEATKQAYKNGYEAGQQAIRERMDTVIAELETLANEAYAKSTRFASAYSSNQSGKYSAYHKAADLIKKALRTDQKGGFGSTGAF